VVQLRHAGAFLLTRLLVRALPVTSGSVRGVTSAGAPRWASRQEQRSHEAM
jgi:hypothetical protein